MGALRRIALLLLLAVPAAAEVRRVPALEFDPADGIAEAVGRLTGGDAVTYGFLARAGQELRADIGSESGVATFDLFGPGGGVIGEARSGMLKMALPQDGAYALMVSLVGASGETGYLLTVELGDPDAGDADADGAAVPAGAAAPEPMPEPADAAQEAAVAWWQVAGLDGAMLNLRAGPRLDAPVLAQLAEGQVLRGSGCAGEGEARWCRVAAPDEAVEGWVAARFLRPAVAPAGGGTRPRPRPGPAD